MTNRLLYIVLFIVSLIVLLALYLSSGSTIRTTQVAPVTGTTKQRLHIEEIEEPVILQLLDEKEQTPVCKQPKPIKHKYIFFDYGMAKLGNLADIQESKQATSGILVDLDSRRVLWAKNPRQGVPIASMTKMMTELLALEEIARCPDISLQTPVKVTVSASRIGGSQVYLDPRETFTLEELLKATTIHSANDAAQLIAEYIGKGDSEAFVEKMNAKARKLRMPNTRFFNPHGLGGKSLAYDNVSSPEGMAILAEHLLQYPEAVKWSSTWTTYFRNDTKNRMILTNRNKLIHTRPNAGCNGVDGMKTGYIRRSGFCITATCKRNGRRLLAVATGFKSSKTRNLFIRELLDWGYSQKQETK